MDRTHLDGKQCLGLIPWADAANDGKLAIQINRLDFSADARDVRDLVDQTSDQEVVGGREQIAG